jgi:hypothetical protein
MDVDLVTAIQSITLLSKMSRLRFREQGTGNREQGTGNGESRTEDEERRHRFTIRVK